MEEQTIALKERVSTSSLDLATCLGEFAEDLMLVVDRNFNLQYVNSFAAKLLGLPATEMVGKGLGEVLPSFTDEINENKLRKTLDLGDLNCFDSEARISGKRVWLNTRVSPIRDVSKQVVAALIVSRDITERKVQETIIARSKQEWLQAIDSMSHMLAVVDDHFRIRRINTAMARRLGVSVHEAVGLICYEHLSGTRQPPPICPLLQIVINGDSRYIKTREIQEFGKVVATISPYRDAQGKIKGCVYFARDMDRIMSEPPHIDAPMRSLMHKADYIVAVQNRNGKYTFLSTHPSDGIEFQQFIGKSPYECFEKSMADRLMDRLGSVLTAGIELAELTEFNWSGVSIKFYDRVSPIRDSGGYINSIVTISQKIEDAATESADSFTQTDPLHALSNRETEVLQLIASGLTNQQIADKLFISRKTVETHRSRIMKKLDVNKASALVRHALASGLI